MPVRPRAEAGSFPGLPDAGRTQRRRDLGRALLGRRLRPGDDRGRTPPRPAPSRALDDPTDGLRGVLPHGRRHHGRHPRDGDPRRVPRLGRRLARLLPPPDLRRRRAPSRPRVRTLPEPDARRAPGHRRRRRVRAARGRLRHGALAPRRRADRLRRDDRHLSGARCGPRGRQGARPAGGRGRDGGEVVPAHLGAEPPGVARAPPGARRDQPPDGPAGAAVPRGRAARRLPASHRVASVRDRAVLPRPRRPSAAGAFRERAPDDPGRQGRRRAARLPEARRPRRADALVDASRDG